VKGFSTV